MAPSRPGELDPRFVTQPQPPAYLALHRSGELVERAERAGRELADCRACPRDCGADRAGGEVGWCRIARDPVVASAFPHFGEEDCLRGQRGSGTIFLSGCNLGCVFCQNADISHGLAGRPLDSAGIARLMLRLQDRGCHNINLVTPEHVVPQLVESIALAAEAGLRLPIVYNTSGYDSPSSLALLDGVVDIYMPDFKVWEPATAKRLLKAADYPERARAAIAEMHRQVGSLLVDRDGVAVRGLLVRHLVMPGQLAEATAIMGWLAELDPDTYVNIMAQYRPEHRVGGTGARYPEIDRPPARAEIDAVYAAARATGLHRFDQRHDEIVLCF